MGRAPNLDGADPPAADGATTLDRRRLVGGTLAVSAALVAAQRRRPVASALPSVEPSTATPAMPLPGFAESTRWRGRTLVVGAWGGEVQAALRRAIWQPFAAATGCDVREVRTDYDRLASTTGGAFFADLLVVDPVWAVDALDRGRIVAIDPGAIDPVAATPFPGGAGTIPAYAYALVAAYRRDGARGAVPPANWAEWWNTVGLPGARTLSRDPFGTLELALLADGVSADALYPLDLDRAIASLRTIVGAIADRWWETGEQPVAWLGTNRADLASAWHYRVVAGQWDGYDVDLSWRQGLLVVDRWAIPIGARALDVAADLLRYAQLPEVQAAFARVVPLGPTHPGAADLLDPLALSTLPTAPGVSPLLVAADAAWWSINRPAALRRMNDLLVENAGA